MNIESEIKSIFRGGRTPEEKSKDIMKITNFNKEDILNTISKGGKNVSELYENLIKLDKKRKKV